MKFSYTIILLAGTLSTLTEGCSQSDNKRKVDHADIDSVAVFSLKKGQINKQITFPAELTPLNRAEIYSKVSGYINDFKVDIGDHVKKGDVLAILDAPEIISNYSQVYSEELAASSKYRTSSDVYERFLKSSKTLGTIAPEELEKSKNLMLSDSSSLEAAKSKLKAYAQLKDYLIIRAPFNGIITQRNFDQGTLVGINNSKPILIVENIEKLRLRVPVPEAYTMTIPDTSVIRFTVDAQPGKIFTATLARKSGSINLLNRTETWEYIYQNKNDEIKSGMFANASIKFGRKELPFLVPESAVVTNLEKRFVIRLNNNKTELVDVTNGISQNDKVEIFGALSEGDILLVKPGDEIKPGTKLIGKMKSN